MYETSVSKEIREWLLVLAIVFTVAWTSHAFFFKEKQTQEPTALELEVQLENAGEKDGFIMVKGTINTLNPSGRRIYIPALWYTVEGSRVSPSRERVSDLGKLPAELPGDNAAIRNYAPVVSAQIVLEKKLLSSRYPFWNPQDKTTEEISFAVPKGEFDFLDMKVTYLFARNNQELLDPGWTRGTEGELWAYLKFEQEKTEEQRNQWLYENGAGVNWSKASLPLWDKPKIQ
jgi:hypothetical protein